MSSNISGSMSSSMGSISSISSSTALAHDATRMRPFTSPWSSLDLQQFHHALCPRDREVADGDGDNSRGDMDLGAVIYWSRGPRDPIADVYFLMLALMLTSAMPQAGRPRIAAAPATTRLAPTSPARPDAALRLLAARLAQAAPTTVAAAVMLPLRA
jgi:hypothetical protein